MFPILILSIISISKIIVFELFKLISVVFSKKESNFLETNGESNFNSDF